MECSASLPLEEHYEAQASSSSAAAAGGGGGGGRLYLDAYEVSFPLEESTERPPSYHLNQGQQMVDGTPRARHMTTDDLAVDQAGGQRSEDKNDQIFLISLSPPVPEPVVQEPPHSQYSPFILVSNLRAHLYVALEKNAWLQKRIEELEEERNFLRCQLDRFIVSMRGPEGKRAPLLLWFSDQHNREKSSFIYQIKLHLTFRIL